MKASMRYVRGRPPVPDWHIVRLINMQALRGLIRSPSIYITLTLGLVGTLIALRNSLSIVNSNFLTVLFEPFIAPLLGMALLGSLFIALVASLSVAHERELGLLETLFYGPVRAREYLLGKHLAHLTAYVGMLAAFLMACLLLSWLTHFALSPLLLPIGGLAVADTFALIGLGILMATLTRTIRGTLFLFLSFVLGVLGIHAAQVILTGIVSSQSFTSLAVLRDTITALDRVVNWLSPAAYLLQGTDAAVRGSWWEVGWYVVAALFYGSSCQVLAVLRLQHTGVLR